MRLIDADALVEALEKSMHGSPEEPFDYGWDGALIQAIDLIKAQPEPTGMVVPLDAFTALLDCLEQHKLHDPNDPNDQLAHFIAINRQIAKDAVPAGNEWLPIEQAPKGNCEVIGWGRHVYDGHHDCREVITRSTSGGWHTKDLRLFDPVCFQYLPEPPAKEVGDA